MLHSLVNFILWVYFFNYQRSFFWSWVFITLFALKRLLYWGYLYLAVRGVWWACWGALNLEFSLIKLVYIAFVRVATGFIQATLTYTSGVNWGYPILGLLRARSVLIGVGCALAQVLSRWALTSHKGASLRANTFNATYADSGVWDTYLLVSFDRIFRAVIVLSILPLSENNLVEKMGIKLFRELTQAETCSQVRKNIAIGVILRSVAHCLALIFIFVVYLAFLAV